MLVGNEKHANCILYVVTRDDRFGAVGAYAHQDEAVEYVECEGFTFNYETDCTFAFVKVVEGENIHAVIRTITINVNDVWDANGLYRIDNDDYVMKVID